MIEETEAGIMDGPAVAAGVTAIEARIATASPAVRAVYDYWRGKAGERRMPARRDVDPVDLKRYLSRITLVDVVPDSRGLVYRLTGTREVASRGRDPTGKPVKEASFGCSGSEALRNYNAVIENRAPLYTRGPLDPGGGFVVDEEVLFLPLSEDGDAVNMILVFVHRAEDDRPEI